MKSLTAQERFKYVLEKRYPGLTALNIATLIEKGFTSPKIINEASDIQLLAVPGIGPVTINKIRAAQLAVKES